MTRTVTSLENHVTGILAAYSGLGFPVGDGIDPKRGGLEHNPPYAVLYILSGGGFDGPINDSQADILFHYQITAVGKTQVEALRVLDQIRTVNTKTNIVISGRKVRNVIQMNSSGGTRRDDDVSVPLFYAYDLWELDTTPTT